MAGRFDISDYVQVNERCALPRTIWKERGFEHGRQV